MLDVSKLATLRSVVEHGSFSGAGQAVGLTQPAVSRQVSALERQLGTQLVRRTQQGVHPTEAGRVLVGHAEVVLGRLAVAEQQIADLAGLRAGHVRLGSFFTALVYLSAELAALLETRHPALFRNQPDVIEDQLVDRAAAFRGLAAAELDVAIVFEHAFEPNPAPEGIELLPLFDDPPCALVPAGHPLSGARSVNPAQLAGDTWIRPHRGSAGRLLDRVLDDAGLRPEILLAGHGVMIAHRLNVLIDPAQIAVVGLDEAPVRHIQAAIMRGQRAPAARAVIDALLETGRRRSERLSR